MTSYNSKSRSENSIRNVSFGFLTQIVTIVLEFVVRTVFLKVLGEALLGVSGLFSNILMLLNLAELGIHNAINFALYKPIAQNDIDTVNRILAFYKKCYYAIAIFIAIVGGALTPFVRVLINYEGTLDNIEIYYVLYVFQTVSTYLFSYRAVLLNATQNQRIVSKVSLYVKIVFSVFEILAILLLRSFYIYLILYILGNVLTNVITSLIATKRFPRSFSRSKDSILSKEEKRNIFTDIKAFMLYKIGGVLSNGTDNIIISKFIGLVYVARYTNYRTIMMAIRTILISCVSSVTASVGNLNVEKNNEKSLSVYYTVNFISFLLFGLFAVGYCSVADNFIIMWIGKKYSLDKLTIIAITFDFFVYGMDNVNVIFRNTLGVFRIGKYRPIIGAIINLVLSVIWAKIYGLSGVIFATVISRLLTTVWYDPYIIIKRGLNASPFKYYILYIVDLLIISVSVFVVEATKKYVKLGTITGFFVYGFESVVVFLTMAFLLYRKTQEYSDTKKLIEKILKQKLFKLKSMR